MAYQKPIPEVLKIADEMENPEERALFLKKNMRDSLSKVLACFHNPDIEFERIKDVKYSTKHNKAGISDSTLDHEIKRLYLFQKSHALTEERKRTKLIQILESMYDVESDLVANYILPKKNPYKNINKNFIKKYFPQILSITLDRK
jgi:hypothetical protein